MEKVTAHYPFIITRTQGGFALVNRDTGQHTPIERGTQIDTKNGPIIFNDLNERGLNLSMSKKTFAGMRLKNDMLAPVEDFMARNELGLAFTQAQPVRGTAVTVSEIGGKPYARISGASPDQAMHDTQAAINAIMKQTQNALAAKNSAANPTDDALKALGFSDADIAAISPNTRIKAPKEEPRGMTKADGRAPASPFTVPRGDHTGAMPADGPTTADFSGESIGTPKGSPVNTQPQKPNEWQPSSDEEYFERLKKRGIPVVKPKAEEMTPAEQGIHNGTLKANILGLPNHALPHVEDIKNAFESVAAELQAFDTDNNKTLSVAEIFKAQESDKWDAIQKKLDVLHKDGKIDSTELQGVLDKLPDGFTVDKSELLAALNTPAAPKPEKQTRR